MTSCWKLTSGCQPSTARLGGVADEVIDLGGAQELRIELHVLAGIETGVGERHVHQLADRMALAGRDDVVVRLVLLQHQPHRAHVVAGEAPVALRVEIAEMQRVGEPELDAATPSVTLRVTNSRPRRGDSWLKRMPETANRS